MNTAIKRTVLAAIFLALLCPTILCATETPQIYIVKKGDTLWGISKRFIKDPAYWPKLWANNPEIPNPHLIYPGQTLHIYENRIVVAPPEPPAPPEEPVVEEKPPAPAPAAEPIVSKRVKVPAGKEGFVTLDDIGKVGSIIDATDNRIMIGEGDHIFVRPKRGHEFQVGETLLIYAYGKQIDHPVTKLPAGTRIIELGVLQIDELHEEVATATVLDAYKEIERGALIRLLTTHNEEILSMDTDADISGVIIDSLSGQITLGESDIIYIDAGDDKGLKSGDNLYIYRKRVATDLAIGRDINLPDIRLGSAVIIKTYPMTSTAMITTSKEPIYRGDPLNTQYR